MRKALPLLAALTLMATSAFADFKAEVYGYVKLEGEYNSRNTGNVPSPAPTSVPLNNNEADRHPEILVDARESRFGIKATDDFNKIKMTGVIEADFYTSAGDGVVANGRAPRLRLAYAKGELHTGLFLLAGQFWTTFMNDVIAQPNLIDFNGPAGALFCREPQLRMGYVRTISETLGDWMLQVSLEKQGVITEGNFISPLSGNDPFQGGGQLWPLGVFKFSWLLKKFQIEAALCGSQDIVVLNKHGAESKTYSWGAQTTAQYSYKDLTLFGSISHLSGLNRLANGNFPDAALNLHGHLRPIKGNGWYLGGSWQFNETTSLNTVAGWQQASQIPGSFFTGNAIGKIRSFHFNVLRQFWKRWQTGLEYEFMYVKGFNKVPGHVNIIHTAIYYFF